MNEKCYRCGRGGTPTEALRDLDEARISARLANRLLWTAVLANFIAVMGWTVWAVQDLSQAATVGWGVMLSVVSLALVATTVAAVADLISRQRKVRQSQYRYEDAILEGTK